METLKGNRRHFLKTAAVGAGAVTAHFTQSSRACAQNSGKTMLPPVTTDNLVAVLQELIFARGPVGQEKEVRVISERLLKGLCDEVWIDEAENVCGVIKGKGSKETPIVRIMAHMDENGMLVKRVNADGTLRVRNLGGINPGNIGQGPVDILADSGVIPGVLSLGPMHSSSETPNPYATRTEAMAWNHMFVFTRKSAEELAKLGVHAGTLVAIAGERRTLFEVGDCIGGWFMDDRAGIAIILGALALLKEKKERPENDVYVAMTTQEEIGAIGASYASRKLPGDITLAVDVGPVASEYRTELTADPIIAFGDGSSIYSKTVSNRLLELAQKEGIKTQTAVWESYGSDASISKRYGQSALSGLLCIATENTHGYEIITKEGLLSSARLLAEYMKKPV